jgi:hypothetical protein
MKDIGRGNDFLNRTLIAQEIRARIDKWDCIKLESFYNERKQIPESRDN